MHDALRFVESCIERHAEQAWRAAYVMLSNAADADDLLQQAFLVAWRKADSAPRDNTWPWLAAIIANEARNFRRKRARRRGVSLQSIGEPAMQNDPDRRLQQAELAALVHVSLAELSEDQRIAIVLTHLSGLSQSQAAEALGVPLNTLKARVRRGLDSLRDALGKQAPGLEGTLKNLQVGAPPGGFIAAKASWTASLSAHVAVAGTATAAGAAGVKTVIATAAAMLVLSVGVIAAIVSQPQKPAPKQQAAAAINDEPMAPKDNSSMPEPEPVRANRAEPIAPAQREPQPARQAEPEEVPEPAPEPEPEAEVRPQSSVETPPPSGAPGFGARWSSCAGPPGDLKDFWRVWRDRKATCLEKAEAVHGLGSGDRKLIDAYLAVLESDVWQYRASVTAAIQGETDEGLLAALENFLFDEKDVAKNPSAAEHILWALYNNSTWATPEKWDQAVSLVTAKKVPDKVKARMLRELGVFRGDPGDEDAQAAARHNVKILVDLLAFGRDENKLNLELRNLISDSLASLTGKDFGDGVYMWQYFVATMKESEPLKPRQALRFKDELAEVELEGMSFDSPTPRPTNMEVLVLPEFGCSSRYWQPYLHRLNRTFKVTYLDLPDCSRMRDLEWMRNPDGSINRKAYYYPLKQVVELLEEHRKQEKQKKVGLIAHGVSAWIAFEYLRLHPESVAFAVVVQGWSGQESRERARSNMEQSKDDAYKYCAQDLIYDPSGRIGRLSLNEEQKFWAQTGCYKHRWGDPKALEPIFYAQEPWQKQFEGDVRALVPKYEITDWAKSKRVNVPVLFVSGAGDPMYPEKDEKTFKKIFTNMTWATYEDSADTPWAEEPLRFEDDVQKLIDDNKIVEGLKKLGQDR
ncbi:MAG: sigma-70 family RNA polymerase sigma factor [Planctomycetes bacterium]|nr:sigma-70 family RNA polymerase sigma factor [Planctomycetota bacterium]